MQWSTYWEHELVYWRAEAIWQVCGWDVRMGWC